MDQKPRNEVSEFERAQRRRNLRTAANRDDSRLYELLSKTDAILNSSLGPELGTVIEKLYKRLKAHDKQ